MPYTAPASDAALLRPGEIVGIVAAGTAILVLISVALYCIWRRSRRTKLKALHFNNQLPYARELRPSQTMFISPLHQRDRPPAPTVARLAGRSGGGLPMVSSRNSSTLARVLPLPPVAPSSRVAGTGRNAASVRHDGRLHSKAATLLPPVAEFVTTEPSKFAVTPLSSQVVGQESPASSPQSASRPQSAERDMSARAILFQTAATSTPSTIFSPASAHDFDADVQRIRHATRKEFTPVINVISQQAKATWKGVPQRRKAISLVRSAASTTSASSFNPVDHVPPNNARLHKPSRRLQVISIQSKVLKQDHQESAPPTLSPVVTLQSNNSLPSSAAGVQGAGGPSAELNPLPSIMNAGAFGSTVEGPGIVSALRPSQARRAGRQGAYQVSSSQRIDHAAHSAALEPAASTSSHASALLGPSPDTAKETPSWDACTSDVTPRGDINVQVAVVPETTASTAPGQRQARAVARRGGVGRGPES